jgi:hypothetical protein
MAISVFLSDLSDLEVFEVKTIVTDIKRSADRKSDTSGDLPLLFPPFTPFGLFLSSFQPPTWPRTSPFAFSGSMSILFVTRA